MAMATKTSSLQNIILSYDYSIVFILYNIGEVSCNWICTDGFQVKSETERFTVVCPRCRQNRKFGHFTLVVLTITGDNCSKMRSARAARSFWFF